ncbi:aldo/keto reductase [Streptococcus chenjunshii]|uniref:Aldo/keto reductase n=1 Tax=Streptococcus chenjunshii TaxID=2173853 RepID=A0A372KPQ4_9STRE|nr:aldo/keto reductase [Streptococcus chenjunshii]AXQ78492.1 aldo/keto reductase [Streptococcus chenjunshii]RFU52047.1 aldo/keto reductase [Streptococcus chenjunshii]RFU54239.1 aldo/keto reductase [Streptococcus chenjunshii]
MTAVTLNNGLTIPQIGFGVFQVPDLSQCEEAVATALAAGYRHIDTAAAYMNESAVGKAVRESGIPREDIFVTSKLWVQDFGYENAKKAIQTSLNHLGLDYIDMYLLHQAVGDYPGAWRALEEAYREGKIKAIGVSNFYPERLADFCETVDILPAVNQIEIHPFFQRSKDLAVAKEYGVALEAWGPFAEGKFDIFNHPVLTAVGEKYGKTAAQVALRWNLDRGVIVLPKSVHKDRIEANIDVFDFTLSEEDHAKIAALDMGHSEIINYYDPAVIKMLHGIKIHD